MHLRSGVSALSTGYHYTIQRRLLWSATCLSLAQRNQHDGDAHQSARPGGKDTTGSRSGGGDSSEGPDYSKIQIPKSYNGGYRVGAEIPIVSGEVNRLEEYLKYRPGGGLKNLSNRGSSVAQAAFGQEQYSRTPDTPMLDHGIDVAEREGIAEVELEYLEASRMVDQGTWGAYLEEGRRPHARLGSAAEAADRLGDGAGEEDDDDVDISDLMMDAVDDVAEGVSNSTRERISAYTGVETELEEDDRGNVEEVVPVNGRVLPSVFGEVVVPSKSTSYSFRGGSVTSGEHAYWTKKQLTSPIHSNPSSKALASREVETLLLDLTQRGSPLLLPGSADTRREEVQLLLGRVFTENLSLQASTAESVFRLFSVQTNDDYQWAVQAAKQHNLSPILGRQAGGNTPSFTVDDFLINRHIGTLSKLYYHLRRNFTSPTPIMVELFMRAIQKNTLAKGASLVGEGDMLGGGADGGKGRVGQGSGGHKRMWWYNQAHMLLRDCDRYVVLPTRGTYTSYFALCAHYGDMSTALRRFVDSQDKMGLVSSPTMLSSIVTGLVRNGHNEEALRLIGRCSNVPMSLELFNSMLEALLLSRDARACFTAYDAICLGGDNSTSNGSLNGRSFSKYGVFPSAQTFSLLLLAMQKSGEWSGTTSLLGQMQKARIKGDATTLNLMLKGLLVNNLTSYAGQLHHTMTKRGVLVWPDLQEAVATSTVPPLRAGTLPTTVTGMEAVGMRPHQDNTTTSKTAPQKESDPDLDLSSRLAEFVTVSEARNSDVPSIQHIQSEYPQGERDDEDKTFTIDIWDIDESGEVDALDTLDDRAVAKVMGGGEDDGEEGEGGGSGALPHADYFDYAAGTTTGIAPTTAATSTQPKLSFRGRSGRKGRVDGRSKH